MIVKPEVIVTPDSPTVMIREPRENVDLDTVLARILNTQGWGIGTYFNVQFISHDRTKLLACAKFVVTEETESLQTSDLNNYQTMTKAVARRKFAQLDPEWVADPMAADVPGPFQAKPGGMTLYPGDEPISVSIQHKGFGNYAILDGGGNQLRLVTKEEGGKALAEAIVSGKEPLEAV
jgi:hypothetical protein